MVGPASPRVTSSEGLHQDDHHGEKYRWRETQPRGTPQNSSHSRQPFPNHNTGSDFGKRIGPRSSKGADHKAGGAPDMNGRINLQSSASSSGRSSFQSNLDRFLEVTTPRVKTQNLRKSCLRDSSQKRCFNPEEAPFFNLGDLWDSFDEWSAYGAGVPLVLNGDESVVQYYVPYLSAIQLYTLPSRRPDWPAEFRHRGSESDTSSEASSDGESERFSRGYKGAESPSTKLGGPLGNSSRLEFETITTDDDEEIEVWSYFETISPYSRVPLVDKITDLSRDFKPENNPLRILRSMDLLPNSWLSVAWYPIYRIPTGPTLRDLDACFLTFHPLSKPLQAEGDGSLGPLCCNDVCVVPTMSPSEPQPLHAFGLASYKLRGAVWSSNQEKRQITTLQKAADEHLKRLRAKWRQPNLQHPDFNYFTSHSNSIRR